VQIRQSDHIASSPIAPTAACSQEKDCEFNLCYFIFEIPYFCLGLARMLREALHENTNYSNDIMQ